LNTAAVLPNVNALGFGNGFLAVLLTLGRQHTKMQPRDSWES
jgi:hypothetical protein